MLTAALQPVSYAFYAKITHLFDKLCLLLSEYHFRMKKVPDPYGIWHFSVSMYYIIYNVCQEYYQKSLFG